MPVRREISLGLGLGLGALAGTVIAAFIVDFQFEDTYKSEALFRLKTPSMWASASPTTSNDMAWLLGYVANESLSRLNIKTIVETNGLYADRLQSVALDDVLDGVRDAMRIRTVGKDGVVELSFTYPDPLLAQRGTQAMLALMVASGERIQAASTTTAIEFLESRVVQAACDWDEAARVRHTAGDGLCAQTSKQQTPQREGVRGEVMSPILPLGQIGVATLGQKEKPVTSHFKEPLKVSVSWSARQQFDISLARDQYKAAREKLSEARGRQAMEKMGLGPRLEVVQAHSYPISPVRPTRLILVGGFLGGLFVGQIAHLLLAWRSVKRRAAFLFSR